MDREAWQASVHGIARESDTTISNEPTIPRAEGAGWGGTGNDTGRMADGKI